MLFGNSSTLFINATTKEFLLKDKLISTDIKIQSADK